MKQNYTKEQILEDLDTILQIIKSDNESDSHELDEFTEGKIEARDSMYWLLSDIELKLRNDLNK